MMNYRHVIGVIFKMGILNMEMIQENEEAKHKKENETELRVVAKDKQDETNNRQDTTV